MYLLWHAAGLRSFTDEQYVACSMPRATQVHMKSATGWDFFTHFRAAALHPTMVSLIRHKWRSQTTAARA